MNLFIYKHRSYSLSSSNVHEQSNFVLYAYNVLFSVIVNGFDK